MGTADVDTTATIRIGLPLDATLTAELLGVIDQRWPGARVADPSRSTRGDHLEVVVDTAVGTSVYAHDDDPYPDGAADSAVGFTDAARLAAAMDLLSLWRSGAHVYRATSYRHNPDGEQVWVCTDNPASQEIGEQLSPALAALLDELDGGDGL